jgi:DNA helicase-2/ATP-dependent DNA helicase PcrA
MPREYVIRRPAGGKAGVDFQAELNPQQLAAVQAPPGPALVLAGAGSGKTRTLTYRVAYLLENGVLAPQILLLTFTNKAAREMLDRVAALAGQDVGELWGGTFHSVGNRILRRYWKEAGFVEGFTVMDREDAEEVVQAALLEAAGAAKAADLPLKASLVADVISYARNVCRPVSEVVSERFAHVEEFGPLLEQTAAAYERRKREANAADFDDLLARTVELLEREPAVAERYQRQFQFVLVDEYQDTNPLQSRFIDLLSAYHRNLMAVGDDAQAIYSWRGADHRNILSFESRYPGAQVYRVETNYRSSPEILEVANAALQGMSHVYPKALVAVRPRSELPKVIPVFSGSQQARFLVSRMTELMEEGVGWDQMAVLYRAHFHSMEVQMEMTRAGIPFRITSGLRFFEQAHVKDVAAFLKFAVNPRDEVAFKRMVKLLPGIGARSADSLWGALAPLGRQIAVAREAQGAAALEAQGAAASGGGGLSEAHAVGLSLGEALGGLKVPAKAAAAWKQLVHTFEELLPEGRPIAPLPMIQSVREALYEDYARAKFSDFENRREDLNTLAQFASQYTATEEFLDQMALLGVGEGGSRGEEEPGVTLSSVHQAKGLEWKVVFVIWLTEGMFPSLRSMGDEAALEEERRLFYVAVTRAEDDLYLSWPLVRRQAGGGDAMQRVSPFLAEIDPGLLEEWQIAGNAGFE